jgi:lanosterol synthase
MPLNRLLKQLREEIYVQPYESIDFRANRNTVSASDLTQPHSPLLKLFYTGLSWWETYLRPNWVQKRANDLVRGLIQREDENTSYSCVAAVSKAFHVVAVYFSDGPKSLLIARHRDRIIDFLWQSANGMSCSGSNGVQVWDTAFSIQSAVGAGIALEPAFKSTMENALNFLQAAQLKGDLHDPYRQPRNGGWPFSTRDNGYIVSDCAAEAMSAVLLLQEQW